MVLEYLSQNAWSPFKENLESFMEKYCEKRYPENVKEDMKECWRKFLPFMKLNGWGGYSQVESKSGNFKTDSDWNIHSDIWSKPLTFIEESIKSERLKEKFGKLIGKYLVYVSEISEVIRKIAEINDITDDVFLMRDSIDIVRTVCGRTLNYMLAASAYSENIKHSDKIEYIWCEYAKLLSFLTELLRFNDDFSMYATLQSLKKTASVNPKFEDTLKENISCNYCRQYCTELIEAIIFKESEEAFKMLKNPDEQENFEKKRAELLKTFKNTSLADMQKKPQNTLSQTMRDIAEEVCVCAKFIENMRF